jgi:hypothetical protein
MLTDLQGKPTKLAQLLAWTLFAAGVAFILLRSIFAPLPEVDFRFFWLAGHIWNLGLDPYSTAYDEISHTVLPDGNQTLAWVYPPHWWAICRLLAAFALDHAVAIWRLASGAALIGSTWLLARALFSGQGRTTTIIAAASAGVVCLLEPTSALLALGQNSAFIYLGVCLLVVGHIRTSLWLNVAGILLISLKPQVGLPVILALLLVSRYWLPIVIATALGIALALPQLLSFGLVATVQNLLTNLSGYTGDAADPFSNPNLPIACTGLINLVGQFFPTLSVVPGFVVSIAAALTVGALMSRAGKDAQLRYLLLLAAVVVALVPLHVYDMSLLVIPLLLLYRINRRLGLVGLVSIALAIRPAKIEAILGVPLYGGGVSAGAIILSIAALLLASLAVWAAFIDHRASAQQRLAVRNLAP